jgi:predicted amidohydrolase
VRQAAAQGAQYVQTPEITTLMETDKVRLHAAVQTEQDNTAVAAFSALAKDLGIWLHIGSMAVKTGEERLANRSFLFAPTGEIVVRYDKIHMFDVSLPNGELYRESKSYRPGGEAVLATLPWGNLGMTICYDLRFPYLYRALAQAGAHFLAIPASFTVPTGKAHWHVLMRARAIEHGCFVLAAAQSGRHEVGRDTYGHSLIVSPWGEVIADAGVETGFVIADLNLAEVQEARQRVPSLQHDREFKLTRAGLDAAAVKA